MATYNDNFNRADGPLTAPWADVVGNGVDISSNAAVGATGSGRRLSALTGESWDNDYRVGVTVKSIASNYMGVGARLDASGNGYYAEAQWFESRLYLFRVDAGVFTSLGYGAYTAAINDLIEIEVSGTTITAYQNSVQIHQTTDATHSAGAPGIGSDGAADTLDDFTSTGHQTGLTITSNPPSIIKGNTGYTIGASAGGFGAAIGTSTLEYGSDANGWIDISSSVTAWIDTLITFDIPVNIPILNSNTGYKFRVTVN